MMRIALCDDEPGFLAWFKKAIEKELAFFEADGLSVDCFTDGSVFLDAHDRRRFDVLFLDIHMPGTGGLELAAVLREKQQGPLVIFTTARDELVYQALRVHPFGFLRKSLIREELPLLLRDVVLEHKKKTKKLCLKCKQGIVSLNYPDIYYAESRKNNMIFYTKEDDYTVRESIGAMEKELDPFGFLRTHSGFIVNIKHIYMLEKTFLILDDGRRVPVSRNKCKSIREQLLKEITKL